MSGTEMDIREVLAELLDILVDHPKSTEHAVQIVIDGKGKSPITVVDITGDASGITICGSTR